MSDEPRSVGEALPLLMGRIRDELIPQYEACGPAGQPGLLLIRAELQEADRALASGDVLRILRAYQSLREYKL